MHRLEREVMWAVSGSGEDFQCLHVDDARELFAEIERLRAALKAILDAEDHLAMAGIAVAALEPTPTHPPAALVSE